MAISAAGGRANLTLAISGFPWRDPLEAPTSAAERYLHGWQAVQEQFITWLSNAAVAPPPGK